MPYNRPTLIHKLSFSHHLCDEQKVLAPMISPVDRCENNAVNNEKNTGDLDVLDVFENIEHKSNKTNTTIGLEKLKVIQRSHYSPDRYNFNICHSQINLDLDDSTSSYSSSDSSTETLDSSPEFDKFDFVQPLVPPPRLKCRNAQKKPEDNSHYLSPLRAKLTANQLLQYDQEVDFQTFMIRFHCLPYATEFKFEVNMHINDHYAVSEERLREEELKREKLLTEQRNLSHTRAIYENALLRSTKLLTIIEE